MSNKNSFDSSKFLEKRRQFYLEIQKEGRQAFLELSRKALLDSNSEGDDDIEQEENSESNQSFIEDTPQTRLETASEMVISDEEDLAGENLAENANIEFEEIDLRNLEEASEEFLKKNRKETAKKLRKKKRIQENLAGFKTNKHSKHIQLFEYLVGLPGDLNQNSFLIVARPEGDRCMLTCARGRCTLVDKSDRLLHIFSCDLPGGSNQTKNGGCLLECIYHKESGNLYIIDVLAWNVQSFVDCNAEFRFFWIQSNIRFPLKANPEAKIPKFIKKLPTPTLLPVAVYPANPSGFLSAYKNELPYPRNGLLFYHKNGWYVHGLSPYVLFWRDNITSGFFQPSPLNEMNEEGFRLSLRLDKNGDLRTYENYIVGVLDEDYKQELLKQSLSLKKFEKIFLQLTVGDILIEESLTKDSEPSRNQPIVSLRDIKTVMNKSSKSKWGDNLSKILFQKRSVSNPLTAEQIITHLESNNINIELI